MPSSTIQMPDGLVSGMLAQASGFISNFSPFISVIVGVLLAAVVITIIIGAIRGHN